jgi:hypothetical protein
MRHKVYIHRMKTALPHGQGEEPTVKGGIQVNYTNVLGTT